MYGLPINYEGFTHKDKNEIVFYNATFLKDFGTFKKGEEVRELIYNISDCKICTFSNNMEKFQFINIIPDE